ncbi:hypothetical protein ACFRAR_26925 [Kitasatospora sp. NPDC056651]|uniref:LppU/SCO3897 family protein n=1 Tax=Kitasatospora sp. NPDC056651 TaxID=3345892 RepID=UPI0036827ED6
MPYGPPPGDGNPYASGGSYGAPPPPPPPGYGYPSAPPPQQPGYGYPSAPPPPPPGYGYPAAPPPQQPYGAPPPQDGYGYGYPPPPMDGPTCRFCGGYPAVDATVRGHQGIIVLYRMLRMTGPFCRTCGTATVRDMSARTLVQGWWSPVSWLLTPITLLLNLGPHNKFKRLPPPAPGSHGPQPDPGVPLTRRPHIAMLLVPLSLALVVVLAATGVLGTGKDDGPVAGPTPAPTPLTVSPTPLPTPTLPTPTLPSPTFTLPKPTLTLPPIATPTVDADSVDSAKAGDCLHNANGTGAEHDSDPKVSVVPCADPKAQYKVIYKYPGSSDEKVCEKQPKSDVTYTSKHPELTFLDYVLCLKQLK